jgi:hypothetical protein
MRVIENNKKTVKVADDKTKAMDIIKSLLERYRNSELPVIINNICQAIIDENQRQPGPGDIFEEKVKSTD